MCLFNLRNMHTVNKLELKISVFVDTSVAQWKVAGITIIVRAVHN